MARHLVFLLALMLGAFAARPAAAAELAPVSAAAPCESLRFFDPGLAGYPTQISAARETTVNDRKVCEVSGVISPQIRFTVRLPLAGWTQRYLQTGCGGLCGMLRIDAPQRDCPALIKGDFVTASTDMGHEGMGGIFGAVDQQLRVDFAYRGVHATALVAKALIAKFYGQAPRYSYFSGCSDGGREALMEAQRYPGDFDGIAAGAPAMNFLVQNSLHHGWMARSSVPDGVHAVLTGEDMPTLHAAALAACDRLDGRKDDLIANPLACHFDPHAIVCKPGQTADCLAPAAADAAAALYSGAHDAQGNRLVAGGLMYGSELAWAGIGVPRARGMPAASAMFASDTIPWLAYPRPLPPGWSLAQFRFEAQTLQALKPMHAIYDATDPDLSAFAGHGGKLLMWHGWSDQHISPANTIAYAQAVAHAMGARAGQILRTFLIPGMYHCGSGDGFTSIDVLTPLMAWVEDGGAPEQLVASRSDEEAAAGKGRTLYPWPAQSVLRRGADPELPASWQRKDGPDPVPTLYKDWLGADFYASGFQQDCGFDGMNWTCKPAS